MGPIRAMWGEAFEQQRAHRYTRALEISRAAMLNGVPLIVEGTFGSIGERMVLAEVARRAGFSTILVYAYASRHEVVLERFRHRAEQDCGPDHRAADPEIFFDSVRRFERPGPEEIELYDTYAEIDSSTKEATLVKGASPELRNVVDAICTVYHEISW
jgi:predicted kinase